MLGVKVQSFVDENVTVRTSVMKYERIKYAARDW